MAESITTELYEEHRGALLSYLRRACGDAALAEDLLQDVFLRVTRSESTYRNEDKPRAWLFTIARRLLQDRQRSDQRRPGAVAMQEAVEPRVSPMQQLRHGIDDALGRIPADDRECFLLCEIGGLSYDEIAGVTRTTNASVRSRIHRARCALRQELAGDLRRVRRART